MSLKKHFQFRSRLFHLPFLLLLAVALASCTSQQAADKNFVLDPDIGVCTSISSAEVLNANGYDYIEERVGGFLVPNESDEKFESKLKQLEQSGFRVYACNSFIPGSLKSTGPKTKHDEILAYVEIAFARAQKAGIKRIVFGSSGSRGIPKAFDHSKAKAQFVELLKRMGPIAQKYDVTVVVEPLNTKECNFITSVTQGAEIARLVNHPNIKLLADIYHMLRENEGPESIVAAGDLLMHVHIAENEGRRCPGTNKEDFTPYLAALKEIGYTGSISMEGRWDKFADELPGAITYLKGQIEKVNLDSGV